MKAKHFQKGPKLGMVEVVLQKKAGLPTVATVSSLPWVKTTSRCLFVFTLGRFWVFLAISAMSSVCKEKKNDQCDQFSAPKCLRFITNNHKKDQFHRRMSMFCVAGRRIKPDGALKQS